MRTTELDKHWHGFWFCLNCQFYTGQLNVHQGHYVTKVCRKDDLEYRTVSLVPLVEHAEKT